jgi:superfamily II DNA/RNA helicase
MGFIPDIERIGKQVPFTRQTLFFTATMPPEIQRSADTFLLNPLRIEASRPATAAETITQLLVKTGRESHEKRDTLRRLLRADDKFKNAIIFCNRKSEVAQLHRSLLRHKFNAVCLHGDMEQSARMAALDKFRNGEADLLIASDVAARGLDIPDVSHVFNFDVPHHPDDYVHRIGRTGRAGKTGTAITIVSPGNDHKSVAAIERLIGQTIPWSDQPAPAENASAETTADSQPREHRREPRRESGRGRQRRPDRQRKPDRPAKAAMPAAAQPAPAPQHVAAQEEADHSHLPAFLLRPVHLKA